MNLLEETREELAEHGKTFDDVVAVCGGEFQITKENFLFLADATYDSGYGAQEVANDLLVIGSDFWLERHEYDGSEWWEFKQMPKYKELPFKTATALTVCQADKIGWATLAELNYCGEERSEGK